MTADVTRWRLAFARRLLYRAQSLASDASPFAPAEATVAAQDAVELTLWALADANGYLPAKTSKSKVQFHDLLDCVPSAAPHAKALDQLNAARVQAKHYGSGPDRADTLRLIERAETAIREISTGEPPHLDVTHTFLGSGLGNRLVASFLEEAEQVVDQDDQRATFVGLLARARYFVLLQARAALGIGRWRRQARRDPSTSTDGRTRELARAIQEVSDQFRDAISEVEDRLAEHVLIGDRADEILLDRLLPSVRVYGDGRVEVVPVRDTDRDLTPKRRAVLLLAVIRAAEQAEAVDFAASSLESGDEGRQRLLVVRAGDAVVPMGADGERVVAHLQPGDRHVSRGIRQDVDRARVWIRIFGIDAITPMDLFEPDAAGPDG